MATGARRPKRCVRHRRYAGSVESVSVPAKPTGGRRAYGESMTTRRAALAGLLLLLAAAGAVRGATIAVDARAAPYVFTPTNLTIAVGDTVVWTMLGEPHTVTSGTIDGNNVGHPDGRFDSGTKLVGEQYSLTFTEAGTFPYFCIIHADTQMKGTVTVTSAATTPPTPAPTAPPTPAPTPRPTARPTAAPTSAPTPLPTPSPTPTSTPTPTPGPTATLAPSPTASASASASPTAPPPEEPNPPGGIDAAPALIVAAALVALVGGGGWWLLRRR